MKKILFSLFVLATVYSFGQNNAPCSSCLHGGPDPNYNGPPHNAPNGNSTLGLNYVVQNLCGLNYVQGSVLTETRSQPWGFNTTGTGFPTTVAIAGLPAGFTVQEAYVYYGCSYTEASPPATSVSITNPSSVNTVIASTMVGDGPAVCWAERGTCSYRCDVSSAISGNGNYTINLTGFANAAYEVDGVTLVIIYVDPLATYSGNIAIWDGLMSNSTGAPLTYTGTGFTSCTNSSTANAFGLFGDIQSNVCVNQNTDNFNGSVGTFANNFWQCNVVNTSVTPCQTTCVFNGYTNNAVCDCWLWTAAGLYWQYATCTSCAAMTVSSVDVNPSCGNNDGSITVNVVGGTAPYVYTWTPNVSTTSSATGLAPGTYQIVVHDAGCNVQTINVTLTMVSLNVSDVQTSIVCSGQNTGGAIFTVGGGTPPYTYTWAPNVSSTTSASGLSAGTYTVTIQDNTGCQNVTILTITQPLLLTASAIPTGALCNGAPNGSAAGAAVGGTSPYNYVWSPGGNTNATATGLVAGCYTVTVTDANGCKATAGTCVTQPTALAVNVTGPQVICVGATGILTANVTGGTMPYAYAWSSGITSVSSTASITPLTSQTYTATVTDANGCTATGQITINLGPPLVLSISGPTSVCSGMPTTLCVTATGGTGGNIYQWEPGNYSTPCISTSPATNTVYTVSVVDNCGTTATITTTVRVNPLPAVGFTASLYQGCAPLCTQFYNTTTVAGGIAQYVWSFGNGDTSMSQSPIYCFTSNGTYNISLTVTSDSGCSSTLSKSGMIKAFTRPSASFSVSPQPADILAPTIQFTDKSTGKSNILYWSWNFGDESNATSTVQNPSHTYQDTGSYCANLIVMDAHGCTDTATNCLVINPVFNLYIPSAFTPNGDGKNDVFQAKGQYIKSFEMYIFDRWGTQVFHSTDINVGWNGIVNGNIAQEDTYEYKIQVTDYKNIQHSYTGNVNLLK